MDDIFIIYYAFLPKFLYHFFRHIHAVVTHVCMSQIVHYWQLFNFYYASRAPAIKIILFVRKKSWKIIKNKKKIPNNSLLSGWACNTTKTHDTAVTGAVWPLVWKSVPVPVGCNTGHTMGFFSHTTPMTTPYPWVW